MKQFSTKYASFRFGGAAALTAAAMVMSSGWALAEPVFTTVDITANVVSSTTTYVEYVDRYPGIENGIGAGPFSSAQGKADALTPSYWTNTWTSPGQYQVALAHTYVDWGSNPQVTDAEREDIVSHLRVDLTGISTSTYASVLLVHDMEKWKGMKPGDPAGGNTTNAMQYDAVSLGGLLPLGQVASLTYRLVAPWPAYGDTACKKVWLDQDAYYSRYYLYAPRVYGSTQNLEALFEPIRSHDDVAAVQDPVNTINGNVTADATDMAVPCPGVSLAFERSYNSVLDYGGPLGQRWTHSFNWILSSTNTLFHGATNAWKVLQTGEGRRFSFKACTNGTFESPIDNNWRLALVGGLYKVTLPEGTVLSFDTNGVLQTVADAWQNSLTLTYSNSYPNQLLTKVQHGNGQALNLTYNSNLLSQVKSPSTNLYVNFWYNGQNELTNATRYVPGSTQVTTYRYDSSASYWNHSLTQRVNAAGDCFSWQYATNAAGQTTSKGTRTLVQTNLYDTTLSYATNGTYRTTVAIQRGATNQTYEYYYHPVLRRVMEVRGPNPDSTNWANTGSGSLFSFDDFGNATNEIRHDHGAGQFFRTRTQFDGAHNPTNRSLGFCGTSSNVWQYSWNTNWNVLTGVTDPEGRKAQIDYTNASPSRVKLYYTSSNSWDMVFAYTTNGLLSSVTNANGHCVSYYQDGYGFTTSAVPQAGPTVLSTYSSLGNLQKIEMPPYKFFYATNDPGNTNGTWVYRRTTFDVNELGWVTKITYPDPATGNTNGPLENFKYDAIGNLTNYVDIAGRTTRYTYLPTRKLASATRTLNGTNVTTSFNYDNQFNTLTIKDPLDRIVEAYALDIQDRPVTVTNLESQTMSIAYGVGNYVQSVTRFDGTTVSNSHNSDGRLSAVSFPGATNSFSYLKNGLLSTAANSLGTVSNSWNFANRLTSQTQVAPSGTVSYAQDPAGNVTNVTSVAGSAVYSCDAAERLSGIRHPVGGGQTSYIQFDYNTNNGLVCAVAFTNSRIGAAYSFDALDRVTGIVWTNGSGSVLRSFAYNYNSTGLISSVTREDGSFTAYGYDGLDRLTTETQKDDAGNTILSASLGYDLAGNRVSKNRDGLTATYTNGPGNRLVGWSAPSTNVAVTCDVSGYANEAIGTGQRYGQLWVSNATTKVTPAVVGSNFYAFGFTLPLGTQQIVAAICDLAGNTTYATSSVCMAILTNANYKYSAAGCLTNITYSGSNYSQNVNLSWNGLYQLTSLATNGVALETYGYDSFGRRVYLAQGTTTNWLVWDGLHPVAEVSGSGALKKSYVWGGLDRLLALTVYSGSTGTTFTAITDYLGTVHALANTNGAIVESYRFDAFGRVLEVFNSSGQPISESAVGNSVLWGGKFYSWKLHVATGGAGIYYNRFRVLDPCTGRFLSKDPIGISGGMHLYLYAGGDPVNNVDPLGLCTEGDDDSGVISPRIIRSPDILRNTVPGQIAWDNAQTAWVNGYYGSALGWGVGMVGEDVLTVLSCGGARGYFMARSLAGEMSFAERSATTVSRWGREGLESGDFVMRGGASKANYLKSGKWQPGAGNQRAPFSAGQEFSVPASSLKPPSQAATAGFFDRGIFGWIKGLLGQRAYRP